MRMLFISNIYRVKDILISLSDFLEIKKRIKICTDFIVDLVRNIHNKYFFIISNEYGEILLFNTNIKC